MEVLRTIKPGMKGTKRFLETWGEQLIAVRYRRDIPSGETLTTVEIVVDRRPTSEKGVCRRAEETFRQQEIVAVSVGFEEIELRQRVKSVGALWSRQVKLWLMKRNTAVRLGIANRIQEGAADRCTDVDSSFL